MKREISWLMCARQGVRKTLQLQYQKIILKRKGNPIANVGQVFRYGSMHSLHKSHLPLI